MQVSIEISMYPLATDFIPPIKAFIERLQAYEELQVIGNTMSTQVFGDYSRVFDILHDEMQRAHRDTPKAAFMLKVLNGDLSPDA
ncbi:YkoF family thiamine/hydroxymethylpyrimidine-binding protein [Marinicella meishanensis]|uniref:YkoF family thiamine/hydroxymethylpyrimidine-binding protein n=1 Tax=Marinicella meishanensis TaxID=2873263 RepID=UPI001CC1AE0A|nr:YkoF family thiamine/hydroxymethylpyrimidine-binding protein [Marinicella sp. NBU2979]